MSKKVLTARAISAFGSPFPLSTIETTLVSTALVSITDYLHGFDIRDWVATSYLLTYTGTYRSAR